MQRGSVRALRDDPDVEQQGGGLEAPPRTEGAVERDGFNLHASVSIPGNDDLGRERLMRYGARPPLALDRLRRLPDGRIAYRIKKLRDGRAKHRVMTPLEFLARLAAIVPPPRYPLLRYAGVLGTADPHGGATSSPERRSRDPAIRRTEEKDRETRPRPRAEARAESSRDRHHGRRAPRLPRRSRPLPKRAAPPFSADNLPDSRSADDWQLLTPNVLGVKHWNRLLGGTLYAASPRVDWASLLRRSFEVDVLACAELRRPTPRPRGSHRASDGQAGARLARHADRRAPRGPRSGPDGVARRARGRVAHRRTGGAGGGVPWRRSNGSPFQPERILEHESR